MKYVCFGHLDVDKWGRYSQDEQNDMIDACFAYDEVLKKNGHWAGGEGLGELVERFVLLTVIEEVEWRDTGAVTTLPDVAPHPNQTIRFLEWQWLH